MKTKLKVALTFMHHDFSAVVCVRTDDVSRLIRSFATISSGHVQVGRRLQIQLAAVFRPIQAETVQFEQRVERDSDRVKWPTVGQHVGELQIYAKFTQYFALKVISRCVICECCIIKSDSTWTRAGEMKCTLTFDERDVEKKERDRHQNAKHDCV